MFVLNSFTEFWKIRKEASGILDKLCDGLKTITRSERHFLKEPETFKKELVHTQQFQTRLPLLSLFCVRAHESNLIVTPDVNHRKVSTAHFLTKSYGKSIKDAILSENDSSFQTRPIGIYPYQMNQRNRRKTTNNEMIEGVPLESICSASVRFKTETNHNSVVHCADAFAYNIDMMCYKRTLVVLNKPRIYDDEGLNLNDIYTYPNPIYNTDTLLQYLKSCDLKLPFVEKKTMNLERIFIWFNCSSQCATS